MVRRQRGPAEHGQVAVLFALLLPMILAIGAIVVGIGNWYTHAKNLQTKVDAAAFAGGAVWGFPCGADIDANIEGQARTYFGSHTSPLTTFTSPYNPQVGGVGLDRLYVSLNQADWWGGSFPASDFTSPSGSVCASKVLDVKGTERDVSPLWKLIPLFPDIKKKARVQIEEIEGLTGLLPIAVRLPQPLSAAAVFYNEGSAGKEILGIMPFRQMCSAAEPTCLGGVPPGLGQWTTEPAPVPPPGILPSVTVRPKTGVVIATSVRPACGAGTPPAGPPCLDTSQTFIGTNINSWCQSAGTAVRCYDADGLGAAQTVHSGVHFIQGYAAGDVGNGRPDVRRAWLENGDCPPAGYALGYFNSAIAPCHVRLTVEVDIGSLEEDVPPTPPDELVQTRIADHVQVRYCQVRTGQTNATDPNLCGTQFNASTTNQMTCTGGPGVVKCSTVAGVSDPQLGVDSRENAFAIRVRLRRTSVPGFPTCSNDPASDYSANCNFFFTGAGYAGDTVVPRPEDVLASPIQRSFMGHLERTTPLKWLRLTIDKDCDPATFTDRVMGHDYITGSDEDAASQIADTSHCYIVDLGTAGGLARDQDEPPIAFNLGDNSSQRAYVDCDRDFPNLKDEIATGCQWPSYAANKFDTTPYCPGNAGFFDVPKPAPFADWPSFKCVLTQTGNSSQVIQGFNERIFHKSNNPTCPPDDATSPHYIEGRNYWHRLNNAYDAETMAWDGTGSGAMPPDYNGAPKGNTLRSDDPRLVSLFFTTYDSFTDTGNEVYPIVGFGNFYVTGYGETINGAWKGGAPEDPCNTGNGLAVGAGNTPPPDVDMSRNTRWVWGHFVKDVTPAPFTTGGSGALCNPEASFQPCVAVLVE